MTFEESYKRIRNRIRRHSKPIFLSACLNDIQRVPPDPISDLRRAPWLTLLLAKWALQDRMVLPQGAAISTSEIDHLKNDLWQLTSGLASNPSVRLMLRQMVYVQAEMQRPQDPGVARESAILSALDPGHGIRLFVKSVIGVNPTEYVSVLIATIGLANSNGLHLQPNSFHPLTQLIPRARLLQCLNALFPNWIEIETFVRKLPDRASKRLSELAEYPRLARWPGVFIPHERIELWHPAFVHRAFEGFLHRIVASGGQELVEGYGDAFEDYVSRLLSGTPARILREVEVRRLLGNDKKTVDFVLSYDTANVFVECKSGVFYNQIMDVSDSSILFDKSRRIRKAILQGASTSHSINSDPEDSLSLQRESEYHLIVLSHEVYFGSASRMEQIFPPGVDFGLTEYPHCRFSETAIYVISIGDFERMIVAEQNGLINIPDFLANCISDDSVSASAKMLMEQHLTAHRIPLLVSPEVEEMFETASANLVDVLPE